ncbi:Zn-dependent hydrolase [Leptospira biflexa serovar Patoc strain 'Patoc 1 (Ames)']|uniref:Putative Zn-dependent hydrolase n=2 Tax=Leptospira biflexa TaxID=172 RepID=B0SQ90_LEPBP|nr:Zn-dependent hydrolase [Leptospira biflexa serovar Patoc strain 'Patoc 1 (Ames)']ABZ99242.1 Putative Zn-dependent hydrolase [Leptospira biflexa serovar Patoc strain 'Patoc 1 (Paris)']
MKNLNLFGNIVTLANSGDKMENHFRNQNKLQLNRGYFFLILALFTFHCALRPSGDIKLYESYFPHENGIAPITKGKIRVTFLGTTSILLDDGETQILTDGFFTRPSLWKTGLFKIESDPIIIQSVLEKAKINRLKGIFVCHSHYDHAMDSPLVAKFTNAKLFGSNSTINVGLGAGLDQANMEVFQIGKPIRLGNFIVTVLESKHTPPFRILGKTNATDPNFPDIPSPLVQPAKALDYIEGGTFDFYIQHGKNKIVIKSSTNYVKGSFDKIKADVLFLGIAQLSLQSKEFQDIYYQETVQKLKPKRIIPIHWDNFFKPLNQTLEPNLRIGDDFEANMNILLNKTTQDKIQVQMLQGFESIDLF